MSTLQDTFCTAAVPSVNTTFLIQNSHLIQDLIVDQCTSQDYLRINNLVTVSINTTTCTLSIPTNISKPFRNVTIFLGNSTLLSRKIDPAWHKFKITRVQFTNYTSKQLQLYLEPTRDYIPCINGFPSTFTSTSPAITFTSTFISRESNCFDPLDMFYVATLDTIPTNTTHYYYDTLLETPSGFAEAVPLQFSGLLPGGGNIPGAEFPWVLFIVCLVVFIVGVVIFIAGLIVYRRTGKISVPKYTRNFTAKNLTTKNLTIKNPIHKSTRKYLYPT